MDHKHLWCAGLAGGIAVLMSACATMNDSTPMTSATPAGPATATDVCAKLNGASVGGAANLIATVVPATATTPTYCKINGDLPPKLAFEVRLPDNWNGKLYYQGGGGMNGSIPRVNAAALARGYAAVASNGGHTGTTTDGTFAINDPYALQMWGSLSIPTTMSAAVPIIKSAYGKEPTQRYYQGCSTGGREGMMTTQRFPNLFDGVIAGDPSYDIVGLIGSWDRTLKRLAAPGGALTDAKLKVVGQAVRNACDKLDGISDGVVSNVAACQQSFNVSTLRCPGGADTGNSCLSDAQLASVASNTTIATFGTAPNTYTQVGHPFTGLEDANGSWNRWMTGDGDYTKTSGWAFTDTIIRGMLARDLSRNSLTYSYSDPAAMWSLASTVNATSTDIRPFVNRGGKLILWHAGADPAYPAAGTAAYFSALPATIGQAATDSAVRFYEPPGVLHCGGGPGADTIDFLQTLDDWVTKGVAPETLTASKVVNGAVTFTRPLCRYPAYPRYTGPANDAAAAALASNYTCTRP